MTSELAMTKVKLCLVTFGTIVGIVGILHGSAEVLKGSVGVAGHSVQALPEGWPNAGFFEMTQGSPVFTLLTGIPHYALGLLAISVSIALIVLSVTVIRRARLATGLMLFALLSVGVFLFGAGRGTPVAISLPILIVGAISLKRSEKKERSDSSQRKILLAFRFFFGLHIFSWVLFFPGLFIVSFYSEIPTPLFLFAFLTMPVANLGALISGLLHDNTHLRPA